MPRTIAILTPESAHFPASNFAASIASNARPALAYDAATDETAYWTLVGVQVLTTPLTLIITYAMATATSGNVVLAAQIEAITDTDTVNTSSATSFDTVNTSSATAVPGTAGYINQISITLTNNDSIAAADYVRLAIFRDANNASDTATGDLYLLVAELRDNA